MAKHIGNFLERILPLDQSNWQTFLLMNWRGIIGDLNNRVCLEKIQDETLVLGVNNTSWMQELFLLSPLLIQNINAKLDKPYVKKIRFKYSPTPLKMGKNNFLSTSIPEQREFPVITLQPKEQQALNKVNDQELKEVLYKLLLRCHRDR